MYMHIFAFHVHLISILYCVGNLLHAVICYWAGIDFGEYIHTYVHTIRVAFRWRLLLSTYGYIVRLSDEEEICVGIRRRYFFIETNVQTASCLLHTSIHCSYEIVDTCEKISREMCMFNLIKVIQISNARARCTDYNRVRFSTFSP